MLDLIFPPAFVMMGGALVLAVARPAWRPAIALIAPLVTLFMVWQISDGVQLTRHLMGYDVSLVEGSALRRLFATGFSIMAFAAALFGAKQAKWWELSAGMALAGGAIGVCLAGDLIVLFIFWQLMALFSTFLVWSGGTPAARRAGIRYLVLHLLGGILLKVGMEGAKAYTGSSAFQPLELETVGVWILLVGILISAAAPPVSYWLTDAYPESSPTGGVWLSAYTHLSAVFVLMLLFPGAQALVPIGIVMIFYGIVYALLENDIRRILSFSIVNQVGFMVCGIGIGTPLALNAVAALGFAHLAYIGLLFMSAGSVFHMTGRRTLTELGGLFRTMPVTTVCAVIGALSITALPFTSGFVPGTMLAAASAGEGMTIVWLLLTAGSAGVFLHAGMKFPWFVFFHEDAGIRPPDPPLNMRAAMVLLAGVCIVIGVFPGILYASLPYPVEHAAYSAPRVIAQLQLLLFAGLAFVLMLPMVKQKRTITLDWDWFYRRVGSYLAADAFVRARNGWGELIIEPTRRAKVVFGRLFRTYGPHGPLARSWPVGSMVLWVGVLLSAYLLLGLF